MQGVKDVVPIKVFTNNCRASLDVVVFLGVPPEKLQTARKLQLHSGSWPEFEMRQNAALVGQAVARRRGLAAGQPFSIGGVNVQVVGTFTAEIAAEENYIYTHLDFLQRSTGRNTVGQVTQLEVALNDNVQPDAVAAAIDQRYRSGPIETDTRPKGVFQANTVADLAELIGFARYLGFACVGLVLAVVSTTMVMAVQDRIREHAVLQTIGVSPVRIFGLVVSESLLVSLLGGAAGVLGALAVLAWSGLAVGTEGVTIAFSPSLRLAATGLAASVAIGLLAGLVPAVQAARADIVTALRQ
jgi:putative ABC transport system permease protein